MNITFSLRDTIDVAQLAASFQARGRVEVRDFIAARDAKSLRTHLLERGDWKLVLNAGAQVYEIPRSGQAALSEQQRRELDARVAAEARGGFQYRYESIRVPDDDAERRRRGTALDAFVRFMSSDVVLELVARITGNHDLHFADGQATAYSSGHFLTLHDDDVKGKHRRAAYVLGLQPNWKADWGGLLMFHSKDGNIEEAFTPALGALRLFKVPAAHSVSYVAPFAPEPRLSVTGWFRTRG